MTVYAVMGSCLANLTGVFLMHDYRWERLNNASGLRSDHYLDYFIERTRKMPPKDTLLSMLQFEPKTEPEARQRVEENYIETCGRFQMPGEGPGLFENLETKAFDVFLFDNLYDIARRSTIYKPRAGEDGFSLYLPLNRFANAIELRERFRYGDYLTGREAAKNWARIIEYVRQRQPQAKLFFLCGHYCTSVDQPDRYRRAVEFYLTLRELGTGLGVHVVPPLDLDIALTKAPDDFYHYDMSVYKALAGYIQANVVGKWPLLSKPPNLPDHVLSLAGYAVE